METKALLKSVKVAGGVAVLAHPSRRNAWELFQTDWADYLTGIEAWNRKTDGWAPSRHARSLLENSGTVAFVGMDFHDRRQFFPLAMMIEVFPDLSEEAVLDSLRQGHIRPTVFNTPIGSALLTRGRIILEVAESGRRAAAWGYRRTRQAAASYAHSRNADS
jgi:hypothetical protein